jgi:hypothetical protein
MNRGYMKNTVIKTIALITIFGLMATTYTHAMNKRKLDECDSVDENDGIKKRKIDSPSDSENDWPFFTKKEIEEKIKKMEKGMKKFITYEKNGKGEEKEESMIKKFIEDEYRYKCFCADKPVTYEQGAVVLSLSKDQNDKDSKFFIITFGDLFWGKYFSNLKKLIDFTRLCIYIFKLDYLAKSEEEIQEKADTLSNDLYSLIPNIKSLEIKSFACKGKNKLTIPIIMSLINKKWNLSNVSIDLDSNFIPDDELTKILNYLSNITSLQSVELFGPKNKTIINPSRLKNMAQHDLIKKSISLKLHVDSDYIDEESFEQSKNLFQKNMAANTTITLNDFLITKEEEKKEEEIIGWSFFTKKEPEACIKFRHSQEKASKILNKEDSFIKKFINYKNQGIPNILDKTAVVLSLHKNKNDLYPKFVGIKLSELFNKKLFCDRKILNEFTQLCIYIFRCNRNDITEMKSEMQQRTNVFSNNIYSSMPNVKSLKIKFFSLRDNNLNISLITSLLNVKWNLSDVAIDLDLDAISNNKTTKILNHLSNITSLQSVELFGPEKTTSIGFSELKNIAEHAFIKNLGMAQKEPNLGNTNYC